MSAEQLDLLAGRDRAESGADDWWLSLFLAAVREMASRDVVFQTYDLVEQLGLPEPDDSNRWGAAMALAHRRRLVMPVGAEPSRRPTVAGSLTRTWRRYVEEAA